MKVLLCVCSISVGVALFLCIFDHTEGSACRTLDFDSQTTGKRLLNHLIERKKASSDEWCMLFCLWDNNCVSINFNQTKDRNGMQLCELNNSGEEQHPEDLRNEKEFSYHGTKNPCLNNPCKGYAVCQTGFGCEGYRCVCPTGYTGEACDQDVNECDKRSPCHANANCTNSPGSYVCNCTAGYHQGNGSNCDDINECSTSSPCHANANCTNSPGSYMCNCTTGYQGNGSHCEDIDECSTGCPCHSNANCTNTPGSYVCNCTTGYQGNGSHCEDIDECATSNLCHTNANCTNTPGSYVCNCSTGYQGNGSHCEDMRDCRDGKPCDVDFLFPKEGVTDYVICPNCTVPSLRAFTLCFWMRSNDTETKGTPFNYFVTANEIWVYDYNDFYVYMKAHKRKLSVSATDGAWHHICFTWKNIAGSWQTYKDGVQKGSGTGLSTGHVIRGGGVVVLGQDQDELGGGFESYQSFVGLLSGVNLWDHVIPSHEISRMSKACTTDEGNVIKWPDFMSGIRGNVTIISPSSCKP